MKKAMEMLQSAKDEIARLQQMKADAEAAVQMALLEVNETERWVLYVSKC